MKKIIISGALLLNLTILTKAQTFSDTSQINQSNQITAGIFNNTGFLVFKHFRNSNTAFRYILGFSSVKNNNNNIYLNFDNTYTITNEENEYKNLNIGFGIQKSFVNKFKFNAYYGADILLGRKFNKTTSSSEIIDSNSNAIGRFNVMKYRSPLFLSLSVRPLIGFNYFITPNFAIGAEYQTLLFDYSVSLGSDVYTYNSVDNSSSISKVMGINSNDSSISSSLYGNTMITATINF